MSLHVATKGIDSGRHLDPKDAFSQGVRFQFRYSAGEGNTNPASAWKLCGENEIHQILEAGSAFGANSEWYEDRVTEGKSAGHADGLADLHFWKSRGLAKGSTIYVSWDKDPSRSHYHGVHEYLEGYREALDDYYKLDGMYCGADALSYFSKHTGIRHGWIPSAASWSGSNHNIDRKLAPPAESFWDLWQPTHEQVNPAIEYILKQFDHSKLESVIWQCGNYMFSKSADVDYVAKTGDFGFMMPKGEKVSVPVHKPTPTHHPEPPKASEPKADGAPKPAEHTAQHAKQAQMYKIKQGDTLVSIAKHHNTTWRKIYQANKHRISNPNEIKVGEEIHIP